MDNKTQILKVFDHMTEERMKDCCIVFSVLLFDVPTYGIGYEFIVIDGMNAARKKDYYDDILNDDAHFKTNNNVQIVGCAVCYFELLAENIKGLRLDIAKQLKEAFDKRNNKKEGV